MEIENNEQLRRAFLLPWRERPAADMGQPARWDRMAEDWRASLAAPTLFRGDMEERVRDTVAFLEAEGALPPEGRVLDIGCGPGLFTAAFAKRTRGAVGIDLSGQMIDQAEKNTAGVDNASFLVGDFHRMSPWEAGGPYDLVFASITPGASDPESLRKMTSLSRAHCFFSCFVRWYDDLEKRISEELLGRPYAPTHGGHHRNFYSLWNLLWLDGYYPQSGYYRQDHRERLTPDLDLALGYAHSFSRYGGDEGGEAERILAFLRAQASADGTVERNTSHWYGRLLWDVRVRTPGPERGPFQG